MSASKVFFTDFRCRLGVSQLDKLRKLLYYAYLSPQELQNVEEIIDQLRPHIRDISTRTYYRKRKEAVEVLSSVLWGYTAQDSAEIVREFLQ